MAEAARAFIVVLLAINSCVFAIAIAAANLGCTDTVVVALRSCIARAAMRQDLVTTANVGIACILGAWITVCAILGSLDTQSNDSVVCCNLLASCQSAFIRRSAESWRMATRLVRKVRVAAISCASIVIVTIKSFVADKTRC